MSATEKHAGAGASPARPVEFPLIDRRIRGDRRRDRDDAASDEYQRGYADGAAAIASHQDQEIRALANTLEVEALKAVHEAYRREFTDLMVRIISHAAPALARLSSLGELRGVVEQVAPPAQTLTAISVGAALADAAKALEIRGVSIKVDPTSEPNAVVACWKDGGLRHEPDRQIEKLVLILNAAADDIIKDMKE